MPTNYPAGYDAFENPTAADPLNDPRVPHAKQHDDINDAVEAIEHTLGVHPQGTAATVDARIAALEAGGSGLPPIAPPVGSPLESPDKGKALVVDAAGNTVWGPAGAPLSSNPAADLGAAAAAGTGASAAREDHVHKQELPPVAAGTVDQGKVLQVGTGNTPVWGAAPSGLPASTPADIAKTLQVGIGGVPGWVDPIPFTTRPPSDPAVAPVVGSYAEIAHADHQHKQELPDVSANTAADANKVLALGPDGKTASWKPATDVTEMKPPVANAAALPTTNNHFGDIRITLDDGHMHVWVKGIPGDPVAANHVAHWDNIGPAAASAVITTTVVPADLGAAAAVGASLEGAKADHVHKTELPAHAAADAGKALVVDSAGTGVEWAAPATGIVVAATAPALTKDGAGWFDTVSGGLFIQTSGVWVEVGGKQPITMGPTKKADSDGSDGDIHIVYKP
ncbi:MAG: hypothetical protein ACO28P_01340 [Ilumatobacteraceae bacterium]